MLIDTEDTLRLYIPNILPPVKGETPLIDKLWPFIESAQQWIETYFASEKILEEYEASYNLVVMQAFLSVLPSLDLVLTPNGFATVGNQNLSPASKMRVDRLVGGIRDRRDESIQQLITKLRHKYEWQNTPQSIWWGATLFTDLSIVDAVGKGQQPTKWDRYLELRPQILELEATLADEYFSPEMMDALRADNIYFGLDDPCQYAVQQIQAQIIGYIRNGSFNSRRLMDIVNFMRNNQDFFNAWHQSETAKLFSPPVFRNQKNSGGYFF